ncbi:hypothetical protein QMG61_15185 [Cryobacterium sp. PH31-AA6]|uniref:hypothetical protein n=1 Tax=Cryobacterium sp. PH31-AA6 TaxID=3046205 RepID=UPI0024BB3049|nr:hypothetical protein [Cryobacterium sp. PH31-AA6]MDJ0325108.1 hypothetical protein [Cryobacterium sp. PH31-AA6]
MELFAVAALSMLGALGLAAWGFRTAVRSARVAVPRRRSSDSSPADTVAAAAIDPALPSHRAVPHRGAALSRYLPPQDWARLLVADARGLPTLYLQPHGGELWLTEPSTGKLVSISNAHLRPLGIWTIWLRNVDPRTIVAREGLIQPGARVSLVRAPGEEGAGDTVFVHSSTGRRVGQVSPGIAVGLAELIDSGTVLHAVAIAFDPKPGADRCGLVKVLAAPPATIEQLFRRLPRAATIASNSGDAVLAR